MMSADQKLDLLLAIQPADEEAVRNALQASSVECNVLTASDLAELRKHIADTEPDLVIVGVDLPGVDLTERLPDLTSDHPLIPFVVLAPDEAKAEARAALGAGARDFVLRSDLRSVTMARILRYARERRRADSALKAAARRYKAALAATTDGLLVIDTEGRIRDASPSAERMFGFESGKLTGRPVEDLVPEASREEHGSLREEYMSDPVPRPMAVETELSGLRADGTVFPIEIGLSPHWAAGSLCVFAAVRDLTEAESLRRMAAAVEATEDVIVTSDLEGTIETWNAAAERHFGPSEDEAVGRSLRSFLAPEALEELPDVLRRLRAGEHVSSVDNPDRDAEGKEFHLSLSFSPVAGRDGAPHAAVLVGRDITHRKLLEADLERLAYYDPLTGLANRRLLHERLDYAIALARRHVHSVAVLYLDLGRFKEINDQLGHAAGDAVLKQVAERLSGEARDSDVVARQGGDEFVVLLSQVARSEGAVEAAGRFLKALEEPLTVAGESVSVDAQIGVALFPEHGSDALELITAADRAMYRKKEKIRSGKPEAGTPVIAHGQEFERALRSALGEDRLRLHYQPILRSDDDTLAGVEALLRWEHPERGLLTASQFLSYAEELDLMVALDRWALEKALREIRELAPAKPASLWLAVNLSAQTMRRSDVTEWMADVVAEVAPPPGGLRIEVPASKAFASPTLRRSLEKLSGEGCGLTLDNFGAGESSLNQLREIPACCLKLDRSLIARIDAEPESLRFARAAMELGQAAGMQVAVEGVERHSQWEHLRKDGCEFLQGFYLGRPGPGSEIFD